ncbi:hypothetical protein BH09ACT1_BH09ACT1_20730 [soil metagenome]
MKIVTYGGDRFLTSDTASDALLQFAATMGARSSAEVVSLPAKEINGTPRTVDLVIGPASELLAHDIEVAFPEPDTAAAVALLEQRMSTLTAPVRLSVALPLKISSTTEPADTDTDAVVDSLEDIQLAGLEEILAEDDRA